MNAKTIASEPMKVFARLGLPQEILTNQGTSFMSQIMRELCKLLKIKSLRIFVYHP